MSASKAWKSIAAERGAEITRLRNAILWALGDQPDSDGNWFYEDRNNPAQGPRRPYWWRSHLREIAGLKD